MLGPLLVLFGVIVVGLLFLVSNRTPQVGRPRLGRKYVKQSRAR
jgi:hypothetical protein